jgi:tRNA threonylcarbamoyladenosine biosynthesis protein TsaE
MRPQTILTSSEAATRRVGAALGAALRPGDLIALEGDLGAGKTALVRGIAAGAGARDRVRSPTFGLVHRYEGGRVPLVHVDAYRLSGPDDLLALGIETVIDPAAATVVEWAGRVAAALPCERLDIAIDHRGGDRRALTFRPAGARAEALVAAIPTTDEEAATP